MNASQQRNTKYESAAIFQGPNSFALECVERGVYGSKPIRLEVHESLFTDKEMAKVHEALAILEEKFALAHDAKEQELQIAGDVPREKVHELVRRAEDAKLEAARLEAEAIVKRAELEAEAEAKRLELAALDAALAAKRAEAAGAEGGK